MPIDVTSAAPPDEDAANAPGLRARAPRADAVRNLAKILDAAEAVFAAEGLAVPVDEVARRAGVGVGTIYRHFPTKEALFEAIVRARFEKLVDRAAELSVADDPGEALFTFVGELVQLAVEKKDLHDELLRAGVPEEQLHAGIKERMSAHVSVLLQRAQEANAARPDVNLVDLTTLLMGTCLAAGQQGCVDATARLVAVLCDGLRVPARRE
jgi:AcrR family transcriptional regulator